MDSDPLDEEQRSHCMSQVSNRDTDIEQAVRSELFQRGLRFRKHVSNLPGSPDVVFKGPKVAVFVDGDFWHGYNFEEKKDDLPEFWVDKISTNIERDERNREELEEEGWKVIRVWQHEIEEDLEACCDRVEEAVKARSD